MTKTRLIFWVCFWIFLFSSATAAELPPGFVYLDKTIPDIALELRYITGNNFLGTPVDGYQAPRCILSAEAAQALKKVQKALSVFGLGLRVFDAYRPQMAVDHFVRWAKDIRDTKMKTEYYPDVDKEDLFREGYIAARSSHTRGSTVDLTVISLDSGKALDMGSGFDFFGPVSWPDNPEMSPSQRAHRMLLQTLMHQFGFSHYEQEWWHFTLKDEPFPETYFNFPVR